MKTISQKERRRAKREIIGYALINVYPKNVQTQSEIRARVFDISPLGAGIISYQPCIEDSKIYLSLLSPDNTSLPNISGRVVRCKEKNNEYHIGIEFENINEYQKSLIENYIRSMKLWNKNKE